MGNEEADSLANKTTSDGSEINITSSYLEILPKYKDICHKNWKEYFNEKSMEKEFGTGQYKVSSRVFPGFPTVILIGNIL